MKCHSEENKICAKYNIEQPLSEFSLRKKKNKNNGNEYAWPRSECKSCRREWAKNKYPLIAEKVRIQSRKYHHENKETRSKQSKAWRERNKKLIQEISKEKYKRNCEVVKKKRMDYYYRNRERCIESVSNYINANLKKIRARQRKRHEVRKNEDICYVLIRKMRNRLLTALRRKGGQEMQNNRTDRVLYS